MTSRDYYKRRAEIERQRADLKQTIMSKRQFRITNDPFFDEYSLQDLDREEARLDEKVARDGFDQIFGRDDI